MSTLSFEPFLNVELLILSLFLAVFTLFEPFLTVFTYF